MVRSMLARLMLDALRGRAVLANDTIALAYWESRGCTALVLGIC